MMNDTPSASSDQPSGPSCADGKDGFAEYAANLPVGVLVVDASGRRVYSNRRAEELLGGEIVPTASLDDYAKAYEAYVAGTQDEYPKELMPLARALGGETTSVDDLEIRRPDGSIFLEVWAAPVFDSSGRIGQAVAAFTDISERKRVQEGMLKQARLLRLLQTVAAAANDAEKLEDALQVAVDEVCRALRWPVGHVYLPIKGLSGKWGPTEIWQVDDHARFEAFRRVTEITRLDVPGRSLIGRTVALARPSWIADVALDPDFIRTKLAGDLPLGAAAALPVMVGSEAVAVLEFFSEDRAEPDDSVLEVMANIGTLLGRVVERERARLELAEFAAEMKAVALVDELTGLKNRRGFMMLAEQELKLARRTKRALSLLFFDLDRMKNINDSLGHDAGDAALRDLAGTLAATFRESDILARIGGDEFCVLLTTESSEHGAETALARVLDAIEHDRATHAPPYELSVSVGLARYDPDNPCSVHELIRRADRRMYEWKSRKRTVRSG